MRLLINLWVIFWIRDGLEGWDNVLTRHKHYESTTSMKVAHIGSLIQEGLVIAVILKRDIRWDPLLVIQVGKVME